MRPIANKYREGKVKSTLNKGVKENLKPYAYKRSESPRGMTACLLHNDPTSYSSLASIKLQVWMRSESESE